MERRFDDELRDLKEKLLFMASLAEVSVGEAMKAVIERDDELARLVEEKDDELDRLEMVIHEMVVRLLTKAPLATDLRLVTTALKVSHDLERVGDESTTIARRAAKLCREAPLRDDPEFFRMAAISAGMLHQAMDHFVSGSPEKARDVVRQDKEVDALYKQAQCDLSALMAQNPSNIDRCMHLIVVSKSLERIGDHAKSIAEEVVYLYEAQDIRHSADDEPRLLPKSH